MPVHDPFQESVYRLIPVLIPTPPKKSRYQSIHAPQVRAEYAAHQHPMKSIGPLHVPKDDPKSFLKKMSKPLQVNSDPAHQQRKNVKAHDPIMSKSTAPESQRRIVDYISFNQSEISKFAAAVKKDPKKYVDKKDYGKTPSYMVAQKASTERLKQEKQLEAEAEALDRRGFMVLPEEERLSILAGLKSNWEKLNSDYQRFSLTVDTIPKIAKKVGLENKLKNLEKDIEKFSHREIIVQI